MLLSMIALCFNSRLCFVFVSIGTSDCQQYKLINPSELLIELIFFWARLVKSLLLKSQGVHYLRAPRHVVF